MEIDLLRDLVVIFGLSVAVVYVFSKLKIPHIIGYLITGVIAGPQLLGLVNEPNTVNILAQLGLILILFSIGIEFSLIKVLSNLRNFVIGGTSQFIFTSAIIVVTLYFLGIQLNQAIFLSFILVLSATAIVLKILEARSEVDAPHGFLALSIFTYQDIITIFLFLITPMLVGLGNNVFESFMLLIGKFALIMVFIYVSIKYIMPKLIYQIAKTRIKELFIISILLICLVIVGISSFFGMPIALGAFFAGLIISETDYSYEALSFVQPFRDVFASFFFVSIGMLFDPKYFIDNILVILIISVCIVIIKSLVVTVTSLSLKNSFRTSIIAGLIIAPIGEFNFVLAALGLELQLIDNNIYQYFLSIAVLTIISTPLLYELGLYLGKQKFKIPFFRKSIEEEIQLNTGTYCKDHLVVIGYGVNGQNLARAAKIAGLQYIIAEMNPTTVKNEKEKGENIIYGDATKESILSKLYIFNARICVIAISDPTAVRMITHQVKKFNPKIYLIVRTRYVQEVDELYKLGADEVIPEEFETSIEIFTRVLTRYLIPRDEIKLLVSEVRSEGYKMLRGIYSKPKYSDLKHHIPDMELISIRVAPTCAFAGNTLADIRLRERYNVSLLAIKRADETIPNPSGNTRILSNDLLVIFGQKKDLIIIEDLFSTQSN